MKKMFFVLMLFPSLVMADSGGITCNGQGGTGTATVFTAGSIVFADGTGGPCGTTSGSYKQDNSNLFYDQTNTARLGIGTASPAGTLHVAPLNASTTGFIERANSGQTADLVAISSPTATSSTLRITSKGQFIPKMLANTLIDAEVPSAVGAVIICSNCTIPYSLCTATGTAAAQWARAGSGSVGCGSGN